MLMNNPIIGNNANTIKKFIKQQKLTKANREHALSCVDRIESTTMKRAGVDLILAEVFMIYRLSHRKL